MEKCIFCEGYPNGDVQALILENDGSEVIEMQFAEGKIRFALRNFAGYKTMIGELPIKYCPMCGKRYAPQPPKNKPKRKIL